jgi:hypothetical protein
MNETFKTKAPRIMRDLIKEFDITETDAAAIVGNLGHECAGFTIMQEIKPTVAGSKGGYGWAQWTGPRRRAFEKFAAERNLSVNTDAANYGFLVYELKNTETKAIPATKAAKTLEDKVKAFEKSYERAGVKHYPSRTKWAQSALNEYQKNVTETKKPAPKVEDGAVAGGFGAAIAAYLYDPTLWRYALLAGGVFLGIWVLTKLFRNA